MPGAGRASARGVQPSRAVRTAARASARLTSPKYGSRSRCSASHTANSCSPRRRQTACTAPVVRCG
ncbi:DUF1190 domain-containing protein [Streptomyces sp. NPDC091412]|uniref:DUF1190 domain-containing protein n=1 Tax=Streptomyces sp. NPDC091412 TaxID=3366002 RepID=UPI0037F5656B